MRNKSRKRIEMKRALIIGFSYRMEGYQDKVCIRNPHRELPGTIVDLYLAYTYFHSKGYDISIMCDFRVTPRSITESILSGKIDVEILNFLEDQSHIIYNIRGIEDLRRELSNNCSKPYKTTVVYFSGHGIHNHLLLPNHEKISWNEFYSYIRDCYLGGCLYVILDCCHPSKLDLQYTFESGSFKENIIYRPSKSGNVSLISVSGNNSVALTSDSGSAFTRCFFQRLQKIFTTGFDFEEMKRMIEEDIYDMCSKRMVLHLHSSNTERYVSF